MAHREAAVVVAIARRVMVNALVLLVFCDVAFGRPDTDGLKVQWSRGTGLASFVTAADGGPIPTDNTAAAAEVEPLRFLRGYGRLFGLEDPDAQLVEQGARRDWLGYTHTTYRQVHAGVPVFSGVLKVHQDEAGRVVAANGDFYPIEPGLDLVPASDPTTAIAVATGRIQTPSPIVERCDLVLVDPGWYGDPPIGVHLAYYIILADPAAAILEAFFVDAQTDRILDQWALDYTARDRRVYDGLGTYELPGELARAEGEDPVDDPEDVNRAYDYLGDTYDYFYRAFGRDSLDDLGVPLTTTVNSTAVGCPNAAWLTSERHTVFCPGTVVDDVVAHELTHGVTHFTAGLIYQNQPGQLNESFSDVFGELVDLLNGDVSAVGPPSDQVWPPHPSGPGMDTPNSRRTTCSFAPDNADGVRWLIGEEASGFGGAIRDMWDPTCFGMPDRAYSDLQLCQHRDNGGVHTGSGIPNHAFAMLVDGKRFNGYNVAAIGAIKAGAVWYRALTVYMTVAFNFEDAYVAFNQAAEDLVGTFPNDPRTGLPSDEMFTASDAEQVDRTLRAVEMNTVGSCGWVRRILDPDPPPPCADRTLVFADDFESGVAGWTTSNTAPPTSYDWSQTARYLPYGRPGTAWFCDDPHIGDCRDLDESAVHSLISPPIVLPEDAAFPMLSFTHHVATEEGNDGGNIRISVNHSMWQPVPGSAFVFNPYNTFIMAEVYGNTNPLRGLEGWTGAGGKWGTSVVDLSVFASGGDTIRVRFDFGKNGCIGSDGWYIDDFEVYTCPDCNRNDLPDSADFIYTISSPPLGTIGVGSPQRFTIPAPPKARDFVTITLAAVADLGSRFEELVIDINGVWVGTAFTSGARECPPTSDTKSWVVSAETFNDAVGDGDAVIGIVASEEVNPALCSGGTFLRVFVEIPVVVDDDDENGIPDECENCAPAAAPTVEADGHIKNRYISFVPGDSDRQTAIRVLLTGLPYPFETLCGTVMWVDRPARAKGPSGENRPGWYARLSCDPVFLDWSGYDVVHVSDREILPGSVYTVQAIDLACYQPSLEDPTMATASATARYWSHALVIPTVATWGRVNGSNRQTPDGDVSALDVAALLDAVKALPGAPGLVDADLHPAIPDNRVDVLDVAVVVDAVLGGAYPYGGLRSCP